MASRLGWGRAAGPFVDVLLAPPRAMGSIAEAQVGLRDAGFPFDGDHVRRRWW